MPATQKIPFDCRVQKIPWRGDKLPTPALSGFPGGSAGKEYTCSAEDLGLTPGLGKSPGGGRGNPFQDAWSILMDREVWWTTVHEVTKSQTRVSD